MGNRGLPVPDNEIIQLNLIFSSFYMNPAYTTALFNQLINNLGQNSMH